MNGKVLETNIVYNGRVGYRHHLIEEAERSGQDLICTTRDHPGETMTIPNFLIKRRLLYSKVVKDRTGWEGLLDYYWWSSDQAKAKKVDDRKQMKLL